MLVQMKGTLDDTLGAVFNDPTLSESYRDSSRPFATLRGSPQRVAIIRD